VFFLATQLHCFALSLCCIGKGDLTQAPDRFGAGVGGGVVGVGGAPLLYTVELVKRFEKDLRFGKISSRSDVLVTRHHWAIPFQTKESQGVVGIITPGSKIRSLEPSRASGYWPNI